MCTQAIKRQVMTNMLSTKIVSCGQCVFVCMRELGVMEMVAKMV
jgi:hypothetical protein